MAKSGTFPYWPAYVWYETTGDVREIDEESMHWIIDGRNGAWTRDSQDTIEVYCFFFDNYSSKWVPFAPMKTRKYQRENEVGWSSLSQCEKKQLVGAFDEAFDRERENN